MSGQFVHWADEAADRIIRAKGDKDLYTCASGITPSGTVHIGNFREIISVDLVVRALRDRGKRVRFIYSWDDYDVFRRVPPNVPDAGALEGFLRLPITMVPDPWGRDGSYARHHEVDVESVLPLVGIAPEFLYQSERYCASLYAAGIKRALECRGRLKEILDAFRDEEHKIQGEWWPVSVFCGSCHRDDTLISGWDGAWGLSYSCEACGFSQTVDLRQTSGVKLGWRIDWPMRWAYEGVDFEPAGKDHHSQGGSFDTGKLIAREVYDADAPISFRYDFIGIKGADGKMSSSRGRVVDLRSMLRVYTPELVRYIFAGTRPNTEFTISFDLDVLKIYEDYDKTERIACGVEAAKNDEVFRRERRIYELSQTAQSAVPGAAPPAGAAQSTVPFRHLCNLLQINDMDVEKTLAGFAASASADALARLRARAVCAVNWITDYAPEEFCFRLRAPDGRAQGECAELSDAEIAAVRALRDSVVARIECFAGEREVAQAVYDTAAACGVDAKVLFRAAYQALIGKDPGPRLASFLRAIRKDRLLAILAVY
ncbi:MAG: lysine--tRNA ligase [Spirochaetaceae bacterium]|jgi:lysyl-tRNA synthetase class 1|nr:lysine--tRNA ligase [Spirochaetaceae bacterium]